jgi:hypothetical protein
MNRIPSRCFAALAAALFFVVAGPLRAAPLDAMVAFDGRFIPALAGTSAAAADPAAAPRAKAASARLVAEWPALRVQLAEAGAASRDRAGWQRMLAELDRRIAQADALVRKGAWSDAHEALEQVRPAMGDARRTAGFDYFVDRLVEYHESMEAIAATAPAIREGRLDAAGRATLERHYAEARARWAAIERAAFDPGRHGLDAERLARYRRAVADETEALSRLSDALRGGDDAALAAAAAAIKPPFARAYTAFGLPTEAPAAR